MLPSGAPFKIIHADRLIDGSGAAAIDDGGVLVRGDRIERVGPFTTLRAPDGAPVDVSSYSGGTILPGFVDAHTHVVAPGDGTPGEVLAATDDGVLLLYAVRNARAMLSAGVTTARENGAKHHVGFTIRDGIRNGIVPGPRLIVSGRPITPTGGHLHYFGQPADGLDGVRHATRTLIAEGADWIKITATGGSTQSSDPYRPSFTADELLVIVEEARNRGKLTGAHATASEGIERVLTAGVDMIIHCYFWEPSGSYRYRPDLIDRATADGRWINPTLYGGKFAEVEALETREEFVGLTTTERATLARAGWEAETLHEGARRMVAQGAKLMAGSDTAWRWSRAGGLAKEVWCLGQVGLSNAQAIVAGTSGAADSMGVGDVAGRLAPGRSADMVVVDGDPLEDLVALQRIRAVWLAGLLVS